MNTSKSRRSAEWKREEELIDTLDSVIRGFDRAFGKPPRATDSVRDWFPGHELKGTTKRVRRALPK
jgi:hypothetical protein